LELQAGQDNIPQARLESEKHLRVAKPETRLNRRGNIAYQFIFRTKFMDAFAESVDKNVLDDYRPMQRIGRGLYGIVWQV
jgi:hypothetical protein